MEQETHDVKRFILEKSEVFSFVPGHAMMLAINKPGMEKQSQPFTMTSLNDARVLEFTIKRYPEHKGVTDKLHQLNPGDELILSDMFGTIRYRRPGIFIAAGAGVTPFIAILRQLAKDNKLEGNTLLFSNKEHKDIILEREFKNMLKERCILTLTREEREGYEYGRIDENFIKKHVMDFNQEFYICGPDSFVASMREILQKLKAPSSEIIFEK